MNSEKNIKEDVEQLEMLRSVTNVYGELASLSMNQTRDGVVRSRDFLDEMNQVFTTVFAAYAAKIAELSKNKKQKKGPQITFLPHNGKKVAVFLSSHAGLYGEIIKRTFDVFLNDVRTTGAEVTIVGRYGRSLFQAEEPGRPHTFFDFGDEHVDQHELATLVRHLVQYDEIRVYYGKFQNFLSQTPVVFNISANPYENLSPDKKGRHYIFEPDIEKILVFFEKQIFSSVFEQTIRESQLAKFASRVMVMDRALENIKAELKKTDYELRKIWHHKSNQRQQNLFASSRMWSS